MARKQSPEAADPKLLRSLDQVASALQQIANCTGFLVVQMSEYKDKPNSERIPFLNSLGFDRNNIAAILGTTPGTVSVRLSQLKASQKGKKASREEED